MRSRARDVRFKRQEMFSAGNIKTTARNKHERMAATKAHERRRQRRRSSQTRVQQIGAGKQAKTNRKRR